MAKDYSWAPSARAYSELYERVATPWGSLVAGAGVR
jgi:hypothetical protein